MEKMKDECVKSSANGECCSGFGGGIDVIVVGAGVAGSALAHTLGKVSLFHCLCHDGFVRFTENG